MKDHFFIYPKDKRGTRTGHTICILKYMKYVRQYVAVGQALKSDTDEDNLDKARMLAYGRALKAAKLERVNPYELKYFEKLQKVERKRKEREKRKEKMKEQFPKKLCTNCRCSAV